MKKLLTLLMAVAWATCSFGALQYEFISVPGGNPWGTWPSGQKLTIEITEGGSLWFSQYINSFWGVPDLGTKADMNAGNYGVTNTFTGVTTVGTGVSESISYPTPYTGPYEPKTVTTPGYYVGDFETGEVLSFWITTPSGAVYQSASELHGTDPSQAVDSRKIDRTDYVGNTIINFSGTGGGIEFILAGGEYRNTPSGQPLPGVIATLLLGGGALVLHRRRKNKAA